MCHRAEIALPCDPRSARRARQWVVDQLSTMYGRLGPAADDAKLVVSEIVTNSVQAGCQEVALAIEAHHRRLTLGATDDAPGVPTLASPLPDVSRGRGLLIVNALAEHWGVDHDAHEGRKTVWAQLAVPNSAVPTFACAGSLD